MTRFRRTRACQSCKFWNQADPSDAFGRCEVPVPWWASNGGHFTRFDEGEDCATHRYHVATMHAGHPLAARAPSLLARVLPGDTIGMRTYDIGSVDRTRAEVLHIGKRYIVVSMLNARYRVRKAIKHGNIPAYAGSVVELPNWGVDPDAPHEKRVEREQQPERTIALLAKVKPGDTVPLVGYPPFDGQRKRVKVLRIDSQGRLVLAMNAHNRAPMYRRGPMAGLIKGELWGLDTSEADT